VEAHSTCPIEDHQFDAKLHVDCDWQRARGYSTFLPVLDGMMSSALVTLEKVQVLQYGTTAFPVP
jgi:hypothetical protein